MAGKIIEIIVLIAGLLLTAVIVVAIPMKSYNEYKDYLAAIEQQNEENKQAQIKPVLESITAELKEGVRYFANDMAEARAEHFIVTANYTKGEESYSELVEEDKFIVKTAADFYSVGGEVTITFKNANRVREAALAVPRNLLLVETDCPYLAPHPMRGKLNHSGFLSYTLQTLGELWNCTPEQAAEQTMKNAKRLFFT